MRKPTIRGWRLLAVALAACAPAAALPACDERPPASPPTAPAGAPAALTLTVLHVNDIHGKTEPYRLDGKSVGGYSRLATAVAQVRPSAGSGRPEALEGRACRDANLVLLLHAGDEFSRGDGLTRRTRGRANIALMNHLRFDAWTLGNGDFYGEGDNGADNLARRIGEANFPALAANVSREAGLPWPAKPYVLRQAGPLRVALFGLCTVYENDQAAGRLKVADALETASRLVPELRQKADVVIALSHLGYLEDVKLAQNVAGIDLIVGAHSHTIIEEGQRVKGPDGREVLICQAGEQLRYLGCAELTLSPAGKTWKIESRRARLIPLDASTPEDPAVKALIARLVADSTPPASPAPARTPVPVGTGR